MYLTLLKTTYHNDCMNIDLHIHIYIKYDTKQNQAVFAIGKRNCSQLEYMSLISIIKSLLKTVRTISGSPIALNCSQLEYVSLISIIKTL